MNTFNLALWVLGTVAVVFRFIARRGGHWYIVAVIFLLFVYNSYLIISHHLMGGHQITHPLAVSPINIQILSLFLILLLTNDIIDNANIEEFLSNPYFAFGFVLVGIGFIVGALFFQYHWIQYVKGFAFFVASAFLIATNKINKYRHFQVVVLIYILFSIAYYFCTASINFGYLNLANIRDCVLDDSFIILIGLFVIALNLKRYNMFSDKKFKIITKLAIALQIASFAFHHPEINVTALPIVKEALKYAVIGGDFGVISYCGFALIKGAKIVA